MIGVQVADRDGVNSVEIERLGQTGGDRRFAEHLPHRVRAVDQEPVAVDPQDQARRVIPGRKRLAHAQRDQQDVAHGSTRQEKDRVSATGSTIYGRIGSEGLCGSITLESTNIDLDQARMF